MIGDAVKRFRVEVDGVHRRGGSFFLSVACRRTRELLCLCTLLLAGEPCDIAPRYVIKRVVELSEKAGLKPVVAPELEFYLTQVNTDPDLPLMPPAGRSGRSETSPQPYGLEAITEYEDLIETSYEQAEAA